MKTLGLALALLSGVPLQAAERAAFAGVELQHFDYVEDIPGQGSSRETGVIPFLALGARLPLPAEGFSVEPSWRATFNAPTKYEGTDIDATKDVGATDTHTMHDVDVLGVFEASPEFSYYAGVTYRHWDRFLSYGSGYREIYRWWMIPTGLRWAPGRGAWSFEVSIRWMLRGTVDVIFSETVVDGDDTVLTLGNRQAARAAASRTFVVAGRAWTVTPWIELGAFGRSDTRPNSTPTSNGPLVSVTEPASTTTRLGLSLSVDIPF